MEARLGELSELLRANGLRVGPGEIADAARALVLVGLEERGNVRCALRACLVKRSADSAVFDRVFDLYFSGAAALLEAVEGSLLKALEDSGALDPEELARVLAVLTNIAASPLSKALVTGDRVALARLLRGAALSLDLSALGSAHQQGFFFRRILAGAGSESARADFERVAHELEALGLEADGLELVKRRMADALRSFEEAAHRMVERELAVRSRATSGALADRPFLRLSQDELERTAVAVRRLAERLKARLVRRERSRRRGTLAVRRTLRRNLTWGGVPARLVFRSRRRERPDLVVLCDVSDSVRNVSRMMLLFVHTMQSLFSRVRSFVFISDVGEVTEHFRGVDIRQAVDLAVAGQAINLWANSNYGRVFETFARDHLGLVSRRTTVLVIGDGRNNYNPSHLEALQEIKRKARRVIWICPEERSNWSVGDCEMGHYERACERVAVVRTLADLVEVADGLVPRR